MKRIDYATNRRALTITRKQTVLAALDAFIGGFILVLVVGMILTLLYLMK